MMLAGLLFLLSLTGGCTSNHSVQPVLLDDQQESNYSFEESGSASNYSEQRDLLDVFLVPDFEKNGSASNYSETKTDPPFYGPWPVKRNCTDRDVYNNLTLKNSNMIRPGKYGSPTEVELFILFPAILDVNEKDQKFVSSIWIDMRWYDKSLSWKDCNHFYICLPSKEVWTPDLTIDEMIKMENTRQNPYVRVDFDGEVYQRLSMVVTSTCKMEVYKFPFDVQSCNLSFKSIQYSAREMTFEMFTDPNRTKEWAQDRMQTRSEWLFDDLKAHTETYDKFGFDRSVMVYTITMRRRSVLYVANILLPILFFFCLDLASFLISERGGEKLSFKVTVLLAVTVMQLILNEILPSTSDRVPLIAVYCIGMFGLMMISLFETILVMYLMEKDIEADEDQRPKSEDCGDTQRKVSFCSCCKELKKWTTCACVSDVSVDEPPSELLSATKEGNSSELTEESIALEKLSGEMKEVIQLLNNREEAGKLGYWTRVAKTINKVFFISYVTVASVFLVVIFSLWQTEDDK